MPDDSELADAVTALEDAAAAADDEGAAERLDDFADQLRGFADEGRTADHGRLARVLHSLSELRGEVNGEAADAIDRAREHVTAYREGVEGV